MDKKSRDSKNNLQNRVLGETFNQNQKHTIYSNRIFNLEIQSNLALRNFLVTTKKFLKVKSLELVSKELNHLAAILHVYAGGLNFM